MPINLHVHRMRSAAKPRKPKPTKRQELSPSERLLECATNACFTGSVRVLDRNEQLQLQQEQHQHIHISTYCRQPLRPPPPITSTWIQVQPLLILDLNGILCHRIRHCNTPNDNFRPYAAYIANTPIVPRTNLDRFLWFLDAHFTLAVWTSAKAKTAKQLVGLLIPTPIKERLLFVWAQSHCETIQIGMQDDNNDENNNNDEKPLFQKPLARVWKEWPLWNGSNTFLMDDSPVKCPPQYSQNTLHPPALHGKQANLEDDGLVHDCNQYDMSDHENEELQLEFFKHLVDALDAAENVLPFLETHARGHMGWRGPSAL